MLRSFALPSKSREIERRLLPDGYPRPDGEPLTSMISAVTVELRRGFYGHDRVTASTCTNENIVLCVLEDILTTGEAALIAQGGRREVSSGRVPLPEGAEADGEG
jgi:hypothetical protein